MCTLFIYRNKNTKWPLLIASNRDELFNRKFYNPGFHWKKYPNICAGKDLSAGGSWLGINKSGLVAAILNRKPSIAKKEKLLSRGIIVLKTLTNISAKKAIEKLSEYNFNCFQNFNLFISDYKNAFWAKYDNNKLSINTVPLGYSIIDNYDLNDDNSIKPRFYKKIFESELLPEPDLNKFYNWKKMLFLKKKINKNKKSSVFIDNINNNYGTVCSSIIGLPNKKINNENIFWLFSKRNNYFYKYQPFKK